MNTPGYGDAATWGSVTSGRDPRARSFSHTFYAEVGIGSMPVEVTAEVWCHGPVSGIETVLFHGEDVLGLLDDAQISQLEKKAQESLRNM